MGPINLAKESRRSGMVLLLALSLVPLLAMKAGTAQDNPATAVSMVDDWTHRHVVFSAAPSAAAAEKIRDEPRYLQQWLRHSRKLPRGARAPKSVGRFTAREPVEQFRAPRALEQFAVPGMMSWLGRTRIGGGGAATPKPAASSLRQDWGSTLLAGGMVGDGMYPAKFSFDVTAPPDCTNDYVVFNRSVAPASVTRATRLGTFSGAVRPELGATVTFTLTLNGTLILTTSAADNTGTNFVVTTTPATNATNLAAAINRFPEFGLTATSAAGVVTVTYLPVGTTGNAVGSTETITTGFAWVGTTLTGGVNGTTPSLVAYTNLYSTQVATLQGHCGGAGPTVRWAYAAGLGAVLTSPALSYDGKKVIYVENNTPGATGAVVHVLQLKPGGEGTVGAPITPNSISNWAACDPAASCMVNMRFMTTPLAQVTKSSPFYDYDTDTVYVGDDDGVLHKFSPVLSGVPAEVTTGGWPVTVDLTTFTLNSPVVDHASNKVFVTTNLLTNSKVCSVDLTSSAVTCATITGGAVSDALIVDSAAGKVFAFSTLNGATVHQYTTSLTSPVTATVSSGTANTNPVYSGAFDNTYLTSVDSTGFMYVCGKSSNTMNADQAALYRVPINLGVMTGGTAAGSGDLTNAVGGCSPVTEFYNAGTGMDWIFLSVGNNASQPANCLAPNIGCVMSLNVTGTAWPPAAMTAGFVTPSNTTAPGASGIIVDNTSFNTTVAKTSLSAADTAVTSTTLSVAMTNVQACLRVASTAGLAIGDTINVATPAESMTITLVTGAACAGSAVGVPVQVTRPLPVAHGTTGVAVIKLATTLSVASASGFAVNDYVQVDAEAMQIAGIAGTTLTVTRGLLAPLATTANTHLIDTAVVDLRTTLLNGAIVAGTTTITVDSTTTFDVGHYIQIGTEAMLISAKTATTLTVTRGQLGSTAAPQADNSKVTDLSAYPQAASIYLSFAANSLAAAQCNLANGVGCAIKLTQDGLR